MTNLILTKEQLGAIRARCEAATPGPWDCWWKGNTIKQHTVKSISYDGIPSVNICSGISPKTENAAFIAHARQDIPALLAALEAAEVRVKALERAILKTLDIEVAACQSCIHYEENMTERCQDCINQSLEYWHFDYARFSGEEAKA